MIESRHQDCCRFTDGTRQFTYDARNRMAAANGHRYGYNAMNLRVFKPRMGVAGDITGDGQVTEADLGLLQQALRGDAPTTMAMDCNQDGVVDQRDTACIARKIGGSRNQGQTRGRGHQGPPTADTHAQNPVQLGWVLFVYDDNGQLIREYDEQGNPLRLYVWLENMPIAMLTNSGIHYLHTDHLHTPRSATNQAGQVSWQADYAPFGEVTETVSQIEMNLRFPGQYHDRETGLHQNWHREYAPHLGRYTQSDPIGLNGGLNTYLYVRAAPLHLTDRTGLQLDCEWVVSEYYDKVIPRRVAHRLGYYRETCFPVPRPALGVPDPTNPRRLPRFPSPLDISFEMRCVEEFIKTQAERWEYDVERWMKGYMRCVDRCTNEVSTHWSPDRQANNPPRIGTVRSQ